MSSNVTSITQELVTPILQEMNLELVDVEFVKEGKNWFLRVYIDGENGIDIDECTDVSEKLSEKLDDQDPIEQNYFLEVSSPGAERPLKKEKDIYQAIGKQVRVTTYEKIDGEKAFEGELKDFDGDIITLSVTIKTRQKQLQIPYKKVASARLSVTFH